MRTVLTMLGIIIGVGGHRRRQHRQRREGAGRGAVASLGQNVISVFPGNFTTGGARGGWGSRSTLTVEDAEAIIREVADVVAVSPEVRDRKQVLANGLNWNTQVQGESPDYLRFAPGGWPPARCSPSRMCAARPRSASSARPWPTSFFRARIRRPNHPHPRHPFQDRGRAESKGVNLFGQDQDDIVVVPYTSAMRRISGRDYLNSILIQADKAEHMDRIQLDMAAVLQQRRGGREPDFTVRSQLELAQAATATAKTMTALLGSVAGVSLSSAALAS